MSEPEKNDFYVDKQWLASYFEKDWMDKLIEQNADKNLKFHFPRFNSSNLYSSYHERFVSLIRLASDKVSGKPTSVLEIGSSLGRTYFEIAKSFSSVEKAVLVEPSENLESTFKNIFLSEKLNQFPTLSKYKNIEYVSFDTSKIRNCCAHINLEVLNKKYVELSQLGHFDLVVCSNVIDQCESPNSLVQIIKDKVSPNGLLAISCTYQWNDKYFKSNDEQITDIKDLFENEWLLLGEDEIEFRCRRNERHWLTFLSHTIVLQKKTLL